VKYTHDMQPSVNDKLYHLFIFLAVLVAWRSRSYLYKRT